MILISDLKKLRLGDRILGFRGSSPFYDKVQYVEFVFLSFELHRPATTRPQLMSHPDEKWDQYLLRIQRPEHFRQNLRSGIVERVNRCYPDRISSVQLSPSDRLRLLAEEYSHDNGINTRA